MLWVSFLFDFWRYYATYTSMLFQAQGLLTVPSGQHNVTLLIDASSEEVTKTICAKYGIVIFTLTKFDATPAAFGTVYMRFMYEEEQITVYTQYDKAKDAFLFYHEAGFPIDYVNNSAHPLSDEDVKRVVQKLYADIAAAEVTAAGKKKWPNYFEKLTSIVLQKWHAELDGLKLMGSKAVEESDAIIQKIQWSQASLCITIRRLQDELKKNKLGSNEAKIRENIGELYEFMEKAELIYLQSQKEHEINISQWSVVTYLDIIAERERYKKSRNVQKTKAIKTGSDMYYTIFGSLGLYQRFLWKDFQNKTQDIVIIVDTAYTIIVMGIAMALMRLALLQLINVVLFDSSFFTTRFIDMGLMGLCAAVLMKFKKPQLVRLILVWIGCILLFFIARWLIYSTFAL